jgi:branched-chain amino acid transport system substrate-binding protein
MIASLIGAACWAANASAAEPIKIGVLQSLSGNFAATGPYGVKGAQVAAEGQSALGRPIELVMEDDKSDAKGAAQAVRKLVNVDKVVAIQGQVASNAGLAASMEAAALKIPFILSGPSASELTGSKCQVSTFRVKPPARPMVATIAPYLLDNVGKKFYFIAYDYNWGQEGVDFTTEWINQKGGQVLGADMVPVGTRDYSSYLLKARAAKPDIVYFVLGGNDMAALIKQFKDFGLDKEMVLSGAVMDTSVAWQVGDAMNGVYPVPWYHKVNGGEEFAKKYEERFKEPPDNQAWQDYVAVKTLIMAIDKAGTTEFSQVVKAMEGLELNVQKSRNGIYRTFDHQLMAPVVVVKAKDPKDREDKWDWGDVVYESPAADQPLESIFGTKEQVGCEMPAH